jgi:hypothetical protein
MMVGDDFVSVFVHHHHVRDDEVFDQEGIEFYPLAGGKINEFWPLVRDSSAFDEFFRYPSAARFLTSRRGRNA